MTARIRVPESCAVSTPSALANAMVRALGHHPLDKWLEPCVGTGVFVRALAQIGVPHYRITAVDLDTTPSQSDSLAHTFRSTEFLSWALNTRGRFDKIVGNPPYVNLDQAHPTIQKAALALNGSNDLSIGLGSNCWVAFIYASLKLLNPNGSLCFVLPAAWDYADYAACMRNSLPEKFRHFEIHRSRKPLFDSVQDGCIVIVARGFTQPNVLTVRFEYDTPAELIANLEQEHALSSIPLTKRSLRSIQATQDTRRLGDVLDVRLGGVTGDASYFLLTETERIKRGLPTNCLRPVLSKARHLIAGELTHREWQQLREQGERIWLFDPPPHTLNYTAIQTYLRLRPSSGGCHRERYKIRNRNPWYRTGLPKRIDGFTSGMTQVGPWICLRDMPRLSATNTLYTVRFREQLSKNQQAAWALSLLTSAAQSQLSATARVYPAGLVKYEPGDLLDLPLIVPGVTKGARACYLRAIEALLTGKVDKCREIADHWIQSCS